MSALRKSWKYIFLQPFTRSATKSILQAHVLFDDCLMMVLPPLRQNNFVQDYHMRPLLSPSEVYQNEQNALYLHIASNHTWPAIYTSTGMVFYHKQSCSHELSGLDYRRGPWIMTVFTTIFHHFLGLFASPTHPHLQCTTLSPCLSLDGTDQILVDVDSAVEKVARCQAVQVMSVHGSANK